MGFFKDLLIKHEEEIDRLLEEKALFDEQVSVACGSCGYELPGSSRRYYKLCPLCGADWGGNC